MYLYSNSRLKVGFVLLCNIRWEQVEHKQINMRLNRSVLVIPQLHYQLNYKTCPLRSGLLLTVFQCLSLCVCTGL